MSAAFDSHALATLRAHPGAWHCLPCRESAADVNSPEDVTRLRLLARRLRFSREHEIIHAGSCDQCGSVIKDDVLVREGTSGSALAALLGVTWGTSCSVVFTGSAGDGNATRAM